MGAPPGVTCFVERAEINLGPVSSLSCPAGCVGSQWLRIAIVVTMCSNCCIFKTCLISSCWTVLPHCINEGQ